MMYLHPESTSPQIIYPNFGAIQNGGVPMTDGMGHNSAHYGEDLREDIETVLGDDHEAMFRYAQWHIGDYITGTMGMGLEEEGAYIRFLMRLYQRGKPLPDEDRFMSMCMGLSVRVWRRVRSSLIESGKIIVRAGCLTNSRFEKERRQRAETIKKQAEAARERWRKERARKAVQDKPLPEVSPKFGASLDETSPKISENISEKANENNDSPITEHMLTINQNPITKKESSLRSDSCASAPPDSALVVGSETISGPGFVIELKAVEMCAVLTGISYERAIVIVEVMARDWAANKMKPGAPMAMVRSALAKEKNNLDVQAVRLENEKKRGEKKSDYSSGGLYSGKTI